MSDIGQCHIRVLYLVITPLVYQRIDTVIPFLLLQLGLIKTHDEFLISEIIDRTIKLHHEYWNVKFVQSLFRDLYRVDFRITATWLFISAFLNHFVKKKSVS